MSNVRADYYVYALFRETGEPFYVGMGRRHRWLVHETRARRGESTYKARVIRKMLAGGFSEVPKVKIAEGLTERQALTSEMALIAAIGRMPTGPLVNHTRGGGKVGTGNLGRGKSPETRAKLRAAMLGKTHSPESRAKMREVQRAVNKVISEEQRERCGSLNRGKTLSAKARANLRAFHLGRTHSPEHVAKVAAAFRGRRLSDETRANMKAAQRKRRAAALIAAAPAQGKLPLAASPD